MKKILSFAALVLLVSFVEAQTTKIKMKTSMGTIKLVLYDGTPLHRDNFIKLVEEKAFDGLLFHRVIDSFVIQGGDPETRLKLDSSKIGNGEYGYTIPAEIMPNKYYHKKGALGMARDGNPFKESSSTQFYIVEGKVVNDSIIENAKFRTGYTIPSEHETVYRTLGGIPHLDSNYTVFGEVTKGMKVVNKISKVKKDENDRPIKNVYILKMSITR